jgi:hypothetical protein
MEDEEKPSQRRDFLKTATSENQPTTRLVKRPSGLRPRRDARE